MKLMFSLLLVAIPFMAIAEEENPNPSSQSVLEELTPQEAPAPNNPEPAPKVEITEPVVNVQELVKVELPAEMEVEGAEIEVAKGSRIEISKVWYTNDSLIRRGQRTRAGKPWRSPAVVVKKDRGLCIAQVERATTTCEYETQCCNTKDRCGRDITVTECKVRCITTVKLDACSASSGCIDVRIRERGRLVKNASFEMPIKITE